MNGFPQHPQQTHNLQVDNPYSAPGYATSPLPLSSVANLPHTPGAQAPQLLAADSYQVPTQHFPSSAQQYPQSNQQFQPSNQQFNQQFAPITQQQSPLIPPVPSISTLTTAELMGNLKFADLHEKTTTLADRLVKLVDQLEDKGSQLDALKLRVAELEKENSALR